jgi:hypothetical protein
VVGGETQALGSCFPPAANQLAGGRIDADRLGQVSRDADVLGQQSEREARATSVLKLRPVEVLMTSSITRGSRPNSCPIASASAAVV